MQASGVALGWLGILKEDEMTKTIHQIFTYLGVILVLASIALSAWIGMQLYNNQGRIALLEMRSQVVEEQLASAHRLLQLRTRSKVGKWELNPIQGETK